MNYSLTIIFWTFLKLIFVVTGGGLMLYFLGAFAGTNEDSKNSDSTDILQRKYLVTDPHFKLESSIVAGYHWVDGNDIKVFSRGKDVFDAMFVDIGAAKKSITKETYEFWGEVIATRMANALAEASGRGVKTHFKMDYMGSSKATDEQLEIMDNAGVDVVRWRKPHWYEITHFNNRIHRKMLIVDGKVAYVGGVNIADPWLADIENGGFKDYHFKVSGPVVNELQGIFLLHHNSSEGDTLTGERYFPEPDSTGSITMQVTASSPQDGEGTIHDLMLFAIDSADESIRISTAYFYPDNDIIEALIKAVNRQVHVRILTPGENIDKQYVRLATYSLWGKLLDADIEAYEYQPAKYHGKMTIIDNYFVSVGSTNFDNRSFHLNGEVNINILNSDIGLSMAALFDEDLKQSVRITHEKLEKWPLWKKVAGHAISSMLGPNL